MTTFDEAMLHRERVLDIRVGKYTGQQVKSASFDYGFQSGDAYTTGGTNAGSAKINLDGIHTDFEKLQILKPELALLVDEVLEWVKMGTFYISDIKIDRNRNSTTLELIDGMFKLNEPYVSDLVYPSQIRDVIREIAAKTGVELATDNFGLKAIQSHVLAKPTKDKITFREVLGQACQLLGYNAFFNRDGKLEIRGLTESGIRITADSYFLHGLEKSEIEYQIAGITCKAGKQSLTVGLRTGRSLDLDNELMYQNLLDDLYFNLKNIRYYPYSLKWQGHLKLDVGQWVTLVTNKGETYKVPVFSQSFEFAGGLSSKISANSKASNDTQYTYGSFLTKKITQMATEIEAEVQQQLEWAEREFDEKSKALKKEIEDGVEQAKAAGEQYAAEIAVKVAEVEAEADLLIQQTRETDRKADEALERAGAVHDLAKEAKTISQAAAEAAEEKARELTQQLQATNRELEVAKQDLTDQARDLLTQAQAQTDLTRKVQTVEETANGTRSTVTELTKTVNEATGDLQSVTQRVVTAENTLTNVRNQYSTLKTTVDDQSGKVTSLEQQTADLQRGLDGVTERFEKIRIGTRNLFRNTQAMPLGEPRNGGYNFVSSNRATVLERLSFDGLAPATTAPAEGLTHYLKLSHFTIGSVGLAQQLNLANIDSSFVESFYVRTDGNLPIRLQSRIWDPVSLKFIDSDILEIEPSTKWTRVQVGFRLENEGWNGFRIQFLAGSGYATDACICGLQLERGTIISDYHPNEDDLGQQLATYIRNATENTSRLEQAIQTADGKAESAKTLAQQTAQGLELKAEKTSLDSLTGRMSSAEGSLSLHADQIAQRLTATQVDTAITAKGYQTKSQVDANITGRGYITNAALAGYVPTTTFDNYKRETAQSIEQKLTATKSDILGLTPRLTDFNSVRQTAQLYERIIGSSENDIARNMSRMVMASDVMQTEIRKIPTKTSSVNLVPNSKINESSNAYGFATRQVKLEAGKTYWFGARAKKTGGTAGKEARVWLIAPGWAESRTLSFTGTDYETKFLKFVPRTSAVFDIRTYWFPNGGDRSGTADIDWYMVVESDTQPTGWAQAPEDTEALGTRVTQLADSWAVKTLSGNGDVLSAINLATGGASIQAGENKLVVTPETTYIKNGTIKSAHIEELHGGKITAGSISSKNLAAEAVEAKHLKVDDALLDKLVATEALIRKLTAQNAFITSVQAVDLSATQIKGGVLRSLNGQLEFDLQNSVLNTYSNTSAIRRVSNAQSQFIKMISANGATQTVIGANRKANDEAIGTADFTGIRFTSRSISNGGLIDKTELFTDELYISGGSSSGDGIYFKNNQMFRPMTTGRLYLGTNDRRWREVHANDYYINGQVLSTYLKSIRACLTYFANAGAQQSTYDYIKNQISSVLGKLP